jgi:hypothetical protein
MRHSLLLIALLAIPALAALPPRKAEDLKKTASHVVVGKVKAVYSTEDKRKPDMIDRQFVIELVVSAVEKGEGPAVDKVLYAKCWRPEKRPAGWAGPQGQNVIPEAGNTGRAYLSQAEDGSFSLLTPNGWEPQKQ